MELKGIFINKHFISTEERLATLAEIEQEMNKLKIKDVDGKIPIFCQEVEEYAYANHDTKQDYLYEIKCKLYELKTKIYRKLLKRDYHLTDDQLNSSLGQELFFKPIPRLSFKQIIEMCVTSKDRTTIDLISFMAKNSPNEFKEVKEQLQEACSMFNL